MKSREDLINLSQYIVILATKFRIIGIIIIRNTEDTVFMGKQIFLPHLSIETIVYDDYAGDIFEDVILSEDGNEARI